MEEIKTTRYSVSYHVKDLLKRDISVVLDVANWLEKHAVTPRDISRRTGSKRMAARLIAAKFLLKCADGDIPGVRELMDRTEGKVADHIQFDVSGEIVHRMEAARQRVLESKTQEEIPEDVVVDGEIASVETSVQSQSSSNEHDA